MSTQALRRYCVVAEVVKTFGDSRVNRGLICSLSRIRKSVVGFSDAAESLDDFRYMFLQRCYFYSTSVGY